jgi:hypothetical protein
VVWLQSLGRRGRERGAAAKARGRGVVATQGGGKNRSGRLGLGKRNRGSPPPD